MDVTVEQPTVEQKEAEDRRSAAEAAAKTGEHNAGVKAQAGGEAKVDLKAEVVVDNPSTPPDAASGSGGSQGSNVPDGSAGKIRPRSLSAGGDKGKQDKKLKKDGPGDKTSP